MLQRAYNHLNSIKQSSLNPNRRLRNIIFKSNKTRKFHLQKQQRSSHNRSNPCKSLKQHRNNIHNTSIPLLPIRNRSHRNRRRKEYPSKRLKNSKKYRKFLFRRSSYKIFCKCSAFESKGIWKYEPWGIGWSYLNFWFLDDFDREFPFLRQYRL